MYARITRSGGRAYLQIVEGFRPAFASASSQISGEWISWTARNWTR
jgi:hypothetical protein